MKIIDKRVVNPSRITLSLKTVTVVVGLLLIGSTMAQAATRWIKPAAEVVVRRGQGTKYKIVAMVKDGSSVELLEQGDGYSRIRLANGKEGWILERFLSNVAPPHKQVELLKAEKKTLSNQLSEYDARFEQLETELAKTRESLQMTIIERDQLKMDYQTLQRDTADVVQIKNDMESTAEENRIMAEELTATMKENSSLKKNNAINWFLAGGGVLFAGMILGRLPSPSRRRKPSLLQ